MPDRKHYPRRTPAELWGPRILAAAREIPPPITSHKVAALLNDRYRRPPTVGMISRLMRLSPELRQVGRTRDPGVGQYGSVVLAYEVVT